jgi:hypothetical protein
LDIGQDLLNHVAQLKAWKFPIATSPENVGPDESKTLTARCGSPSAAIY